MVRDLAATLAALAAFIYVTGGAALMARLGLIRLPSSTAVPQLPREFLISNGLLIVSPAIVAGALAYWVARRPVKAEGQTGFWRRPVKSEGPTRLARLRSGLVEPLRRHPTRVWCRRGWRVLPRGRRTRGRQGPVSRMRLSDWRKDSRGGVYRRGQQPDVSRRSGDRPSPPDYLDPGVASLGGVYRRPRPARHFLRS